MTAGGVLVHLYGADRDRTGDPCLQSAFTRQRRVNERQWWRETGLTAAAGTPLVPDAEYSGVPVLLAGAFAQAIMDVDRMHSSHNPGGSHEHDRKPWQERDR
jgi:hypothetical protein